MTRFLRVPTLSALTFLFALGLAPTAWAQTPTATVKNSNGDVRLQTLYNGGLLAPGTVVVDGTETDSIPAEGAGTRMMWYPEKAAFRAGRVGTFVGNENVWDASEVGFYSVAFGEDTKASGNDAMAVGLMTTAGGNGSTAMGRETTASGNLATAMGRGTTASSGRATAMGLATEAATNESLSLGECNDANRTNDGTLLAVGNGSYDFQNDNCSSRDDAFTVDDQGSATASSHDTFSDRRLKTSIELLGDGTLKKLAALRPVRYEFRNQRAHPAGKQIGLIAQDVQKEFPSLVRKGADEMLSLAYPKMTAVLLKGLQEQQSTIEEQNERIDRLEERLTTLEAERSSSLPAGLPRPWALAVLLGLLGLGAGLLWRRRT